MIRKSVLEYFQDGKQEKFRWLRESYFSKKLIDFNLSFRAVNVGELHLPTGSIVASDPFAFFDEKPFAIKVKRGSYDVVLSVAQISYEDEGFWREERTAFAMLKLSENHPIRWEPALREGDDVSKLSEGNFFAYSVDAGTGCFMDVVIQGIFNDLYHDEELGFEDFITNQMLKNYDSNQRWINYDFEGLANNNLIAFSSGWGDGAYASYFGFDADNQPACLITDFRIVRDSNA